MCSKFELTSRLCVHLEKRQIEKQPLFPLFHEFEHEVGGHAPQALFRDDNTKSNSTAAAAAASVLKRPEKDCCHAIHKQFIYLCMNQVTMKMYCDAIICNEM
jgi:hypothetical protein